MKTNWKNELARDLIALGGLPFLILTIIRVSVSEVYYPMQFIISSALFFVLKAFLKASLHAGIGLILLIFTSFYYNHWLFTVFGILVYTGLIVSLFYLKNDTRKTLKGILFGFLSAAIGYFVVKIIYF